MLSEVGQPGEPGEDSAHQRHNHPADADAAPGCRVRSRTQRHKTHDDVRLPEIAQPPRQAGHHDDNRCPGE
ncbi:hypothetical protein SDC9_171184 [bioreactor metagenome]|uniref:Uncharacterized protein n=1 Tax=bioreactor metagenome TaxID=1076179 RepID=A0A645GA61_9ZZZZ